jgi:hypothetical protein
MDYSLIKKTKYLGSVPGMFYIITEKKAGI